MTRFDAQETVEPRRPCPPDNFNVPTGYVYPRSSGAPLILTDHGWTTAVGQMLSAQHHPRLYAVLGTRYGSAGADADLFAVPDLRDTRPTPPPDGLCVALRALDDQFALASAYADRTARPIFRMNARENHAVLHRVLVSAYVRG